jgi:hypothetical protein
MSYSFSINLRTLLVCIICAFLGGVSAFEIIQTPYSEPIFDNPWQVAFDTVYANGFSLHSVELGVDNTWAINGLATIPSESGIVLFLVPDPVDVPDIIDITEDEIRPFIITKTNIFSSDDLLNPTANQSGTSSATQQATMQFAQDSRSHNFNGTINTSQLHLSVQVAEDSNANEDTHLAVVRIILHRFNFTTPYYDIFIGAAFLHTSTVHLDSIHMGTVRIFDPENDRLTSSVSAVTENNLQFVKNFAFKLLQVGTNQNYLILQFILHDSFHLPILQIPASQFFVGSSASENPTLWSPLCDSKQEDEQKELELLKSCSATSTNASLHLCELASIMSRTSTIESEPITVPISYNLVLPIPFMHDNALDTDWLFLHLALHATQKEVAHATTASEAAHKVYMDWNFKMPFKQSLTPCVNEILAESKDPDVVPDVEVKLFKGITLTPLTLESSDSEGVNPIGNMNSLSIADIRAISILEKLQTLALIGVDSIYTPASLKMLDFVDITLIHVRDQPVYEQIQQLMRLGLAYSVQNTRLNISSDVMSICNSQVSCFVDPVLKNQKAANYVDGRQDPNVANEESSEKSRLHYVESVVEDEPALVDLEWVNNFIGDTSADPAIAIDFLKSIQRTLEPNYRHRRVNLLDTSFNWPQMSDSQFYRVITLVSYK